MSISSETASALMFCHGEKLERNVVVCEQMASPQLLWQLVPGHLHTITWSCKMIFIMKCVIVHILSLIYLDFIWYYICCFRVFRYSEWILSTQLPEVPHPSLIRPGSGWVVTWIIFQLGVCSNVRHKQKLSKCLNVPKCCSHYFISLYATRKAWSTIRKSLERALGRPISNRCDRAGAIVPSWVTQISVIVTSCAVWGSGWNTCLLYGGPLLDLCF